MSPPPTQPSVARMYDYYLGGSTNHEIDRAAVAEVAKAMPDCFDLCLENRSFLRRAVRFMVQQGITQFIDIGSGLPTKGNTHEVAQESAKLSGREVSVVYVDMDPVVLEEGSAFLEGDARTTIIVGDIRQAGEVLENKNLNQLIDFKKPVGLLMMCVACFFTDKEISHIMSTIREHIADGSYFAATHDTFDGKKNEVGTVERVQEVYKDTPIPIYFRSHNEVAKIFEGLDMVEPGLVMVDQWKEVDGEGGIPKPTRWLYGGVGRKIEKKSSGSVIGIGWLTGWFRKMRDLAFAVVKMLPGLH